MVQNSKYPQIYFGPNSMKWTKIESWSSVEGCSEKKELEHDCDKLNFLHFFSIDLSKSVKDSICNTILKVSVTISFILCAHSFSTYLYLLQPTFDLRESQF